MRLVWKLTNGVMRHSKIIAECLSIFGEENAKLRTGTDFAQICGLPSRFVPQEHLHGPTKLLSIQGESGSTNAVLLANPIQDLAQL
jgi:hypothetical protein